MITSAPSPLPAIDALVIAMGYQSLDVRTPAGAVTTVQVRLLKVAELAKFLALNDSEEQLAEFLTGQPAGWAATLTLESLLDILEIGQTLNFTTARRWAERRVKIAEAALPFARFAAKTSASTPAASSSAPASSSA